MKVLIVKNIAREGPGILEEMLKEHGIEYTIIDLTEKEFSATGKLCCSCSFRRS